MRPLRGARPADIGGHLVFISAVSHSFARMTGQNNHSRCLLSTNIVQFVSGKPGVSAISNGSVHLPVLFTCARRGS